MKATVIANPKGEAILSRRQDCFGFASLKLGISDSVVEVSLEGTIRLKEAELPRLMGLARNDGWVAGIASLLCLAFFHLPKLLLTIFECFSICPNAH